MSPLRDWRLRAIFVDPKQPGASDANPGTAAKPWKTLARLNAAKELQPGDTVYVKSIFRELMTVKCSARPGKPVALQWIPLDVTGGRAESA